MRPIEFDSGSATRADPSQRQAPFVFGASACSPHHSLCEDAFCIAQHAADGSLLLAVADGLGEADHAALGASTAAAAAVLALSRGRPMTDAFLRARIKVERVAAACGLPSASLASTLVAARLTPEGELTLGRIGDSVAFIGTADDAAIRRIGPPFSSCNGSETHTLVEPGWRSAYAEEHHSDVRFLALASDGVDELISRAGAAFQPFFDALERELAPGRDAQRLLSSFIERAPQHCQDDATLVLVAEERRS